MIQYFYFDENQEWQGAFYAPEILLKISSGAIRSDTKIWYSELCPNNEKYPDDCDHTDRAIFAIDLPFVSKYLFELQEMMTSQDMKEAEYSNSINIQMLPAKNGDCFLVKIQAEKEYNILIDAGYESTFEENLKTQLQEIEELDLCIITHIDNDHIGGAIPLFEQNGKAEEPKIVKINEVWHNSFRHVHHSGKNTILTQEERKQLYSIMRRSQGLIPKEDKNGKQISGKHGSTLAAHLLHQGYQWNNASNGKAICIENLQSFGLGEQIKITLLSPTMNELSKLEKKWKSELYRNGFRSENFSNDAIFDDAIEFLSRIELEKIEQQTPIAKNEDIGKVLKNVIDVPYKSDVAANNGSSIAFILEYADIKILFAADAFSETLEENLRAIFPNQDTVHFDALKVSHHGSKSNNSPSFLNLIDTDTYIFSTDSSYASKHPNIETIARILLKKTDYTKKLYFNYKHSMYGILDNIELKETYNYEIYHTNKINITKKEKL